MAGVFVQLFCGPLLPTHCLPFPSSLSQAKKKPTGQSLEKAMVTLLLSQTDYPAFLSFMTDSSR